MPRLTEDNPSESPFQLPQADGARELLRGTAGAEEKSPAGEPPVCCSNLVVRHSGCCRGPGTCGPRGFSKKGVEGRIGFIPAG